MSIINSCTINSDDTPPTTQSDQTKISLVSPAEQMTVYPNPCDQGEVLTIANIPEGSKVYIYTLNYEDSIELLKSNISNNFILYQNYPNPFNTQTVIGYYLPSRSKVEICICNLLGKRIIEILNETQPPGTYKLFWNGKDQTRNRLPSGIYLCRVKTESAKFPKVCKFI